MPRRSSHFSCHDSEDCLHQKAPSRRRVSFDLEHNTIHILPTLQECREAASLRGKEAHLRRTLNEEMLSDLIIEEIQQEWTRPDEEDQMVVEVVLKGCLKAPPAQLDTPDECQHQRAQKKTSPKKSNHRKKKKNKHKAHGCTIESRERFMSPHTPVF